MQEVFAKKKGTCTRGMCNIGRGEESTWALRDEGKLYRFKKSEIWRRKYIKEREKKKESGKEME